VVVPDLVGFGRSSRPVETPDYKAQARIMHELLEVMKVEKAALAGYSWGGQVALEVAINWPETMMAFEKIGYDGVLMFEVKNTSTAAAVLERAARARRRLESLAGSWELEAGSSS